MADSGSDVPPIRDDGLQIIERPSFERRFWTVHRCAWFVYGLIVVGALAGLTGRGGYFSQSAISLPTGEIQVPRFARWQTSVKATFTFSSRRDSHSLLVAKPFIRHFQTESVQPSPKRASFTAEGTLYEFEAASGSEHMVTMHIRPTKPGVIRHRTELDGEDVELTTIILP